MKKIALIIGSMIAGGIISAAGFTGCKGGTACRKNVDRRT